MAIESERVTADVVEVAEFPELSQRYAITGVPKIVINDQMELVGSQQESTLVAAVTQVGSGNDSAAQKGWTKDMSEQRRAERLSPLVIRAEFLRGADLQQGYLTNLSESGAFLATEEPPLTGQAFPMHFTLPWGLGDYDAHATAVWTAKEVGTDAQDLPHGIGLVFTELSPQARASIRSYMGQFHRLIGRIEEVGLKEALAEIGHKGSTNAEPGD